MSRRRLGRASQPAPPARPTWSRGGEGVVREVRQLFTEARTRPIRYAPSSEFSREAASASAIAILAATVGALIIVPPFVGAVVFAATALRWPQLWRRNNGFVIALVLLGLVLGVAYRQDVTEIGAFVYVNFVHVITSAALVTVLALVALGLSMWIGNARATRSLERGALVGTITSTHPVMRWQFPILVTTLLDTPDHMHR